MTKKEQAYRQLRGHLLSRAMRPGDRLLEVPLAEKLGISRIPLREAIDQLAGEGLVERVPGFGSYVRSASPKDLREIYEMREVLECYAVEKAAGTMTGAQLGHLDDLCGEIRSALAEYRKTGKWTPASRERLLGADAAFHQTIASAADNEHLRKEIARLQSVSELLSYRPDVAADELEAMTRSAEEHLGILESLRRSNGAAARGRMSKHLRRAAERARIVIETLKRSSGEQT
jgi:DNA-binding GntR family transcriptional regulator